MYLGAGTYWYLPPECFTRANDRAPLRRKRIEENRNGSHALKSSLQPKLLEILIRLIHW